MIKKQHPHNKRLSGWRGSMPAVEITPLGAAISEAGRERGGKIMGAFKRFGRCPVSKLFPHANLIREFYK